MRQTVLALALLVTIPGLEAQDTGNLPAFEASSIKPWERRPTPRPDPPERFIMRRTNLLQLLAYAYEMRFQGYPDWARNTLFDVEAKADAGSTAEDKHLMMRRLLAERFSLKAHVEIRELPRYALVTAGRLGEKLRRSAIDCQAIIAARQLDYWVPTPRQPGDRPRCQIVFRANSVSDVQPCQACIRRTMVAEGMPMSQFARSLQSRAGCVVVDKTGLTGTYDIELDIEPPPIGTVGPPVPACQPRPATLPLFTALREQLGLTLESERGPVDVLVIDSVEQPTPD